MVLGRRLHFDTRHLPGEEKCQRSHPVSEFWPTVQSSYSNDAILCSTNAPH